MLGDAVGTSVGALLGIHDGALLGPWVVGVLLGPYVCPPLVGPNVDGAAVGT